MRITIPLIFALSLSACATNDLGEKRDFNKTELGAMIGVVGGAVAGAAINHNNRGKGALIGAIGGGLAGGGIGYYMDSQAKDLQKQLAAEIKRGDITVQKMADQSLLVSMTSNTGFDTNSSVLKSGYTPTLDKIAKVVNPLFRLWAIPTAPAAFP